MSVRILAVNAGDDLLRDLPDHAGRESLAVEHASAAQAAQAAEGDFPLILADLHQPEMCDADLIRELRHHRPHQKVLAICARGDADAIAGMLRQHAIGLLIRPLTPQRVLEAIELALSARDWEDDIELISGSAQWLQLRLRCKMEAAERAVQMFRELQGDLPEDEHEELTTAFRELLMNGIEHGGGGDPRKSLWINYVVTKGALVFYIRDPGPGFSMTGLKHAAISNPDGSLQHATVREEKGIRPGGFGILLAKNMADELIYSERGNEVILIKHRRHREPVAAAAAPEA
ncbi:MAG: ATP-binding protein [Acidobacteria bacterium]|nr:ATP-binding protein [Acidobacteriota bacterium]